jgi:hypothetical protein
MKNTRNFFYILLAVTVLATSFAVFSTSNAAQAVETDNNFIPTESASTPAPTPPKSILDGCAFVSDNSYQSAILNCKIPDIFKGKKFQVFYEHWTNDAPDKVVKTNIYRTYDEDNFSSLDSYELFYVNYNTKYSFRAALVSLDSDKTETIYSDVVTFVSLPPSTAGLFRNRIYGYVAPEFKSSINIDRSGFKVSINGGAATATTDSEGYFSFNTSSSSNIFYNIKISKPGYIERNIDLGFLWNSTARDINTSQNGAYTIMMCGDINNDCTVNMLDVVQMAKTFNLNEGSAGFNSASDFNLDNIVNMNDIILAAKNFSKSGSDYSVYPKIPYIELKSPSETIYTSYNRTPTFKLYGYYIKNISSYNLNLIYNKTILQVLDKGLAAPSPDDTLLVNSIYGPVIEVSNDTQTGILSINKSYTNLTDYRNSGLGEESGKLASVQLNFSYTTFSHSKDLIKIKDATCTDWDNNNIVVEVLQPRFFATSVTP